MKTSPLLLAVLVLLANAARAATTIDTVNHYAYGANIGWIAFETGGAPQINLLTGIFSGSIWSANCGWISLSNAVAYVKTDSILQSPVSTLRFTSLSVSGTTLIIKATNGTPTRQFVLLGTTNAATPLSQWTPLLTNNFDGSGNLNLSTSVINPAAHQEFYILKQ